MEIVIELKIVTVISQCALKIEVELIPRFL